MKHDLIGRYSCVLVTYSHVCWRSGGVIGRVRDEVLGSLGWGE